MNVVCYAAVSKIQVVGLRGIFGSQGINLLHNRKNSCMLAMIANIENTVFHIAFVTNGTGNLKVGEALDFRFTKQLVRQVGYLFVVTSPAMQFFGSFHDIHELLKEPFVNLCQFVHLVDRISGAECFRDDKNTFIGRFAKRFVNIGNNQFLIFYKSVHPLPYHAKPFLDSFFKGTTDGHYFTD